MVDVPSLEEATISVEASPLGVAVTPNGSHVYVTNSNSNNVSVNATTTNTVTATSPVGSGPRRASPSLPSRVTTPSVESWRAVYRQRHHWR